MNVVYFFGHDQCWILSCPHFKIGKGFLFCLHAREYPQQRPSWWNIKQGLFDTEDIPRDIAFKIERLLLDFFLHVSHMVVPGTGCVSPRDIIPRKDSVIALLKCSQTIHFTHQLHFKQTFCSMNQQLLNKSLSLCTLYSLLVTL